MNHIVQGRQTDTTRSWRLPLAQRWRHHDHGRHQQYQQLMHRRDGRGARGNACVVVALVSGTAGGALDAAAGVFHDSALARCCG